MSPGYPKLVPHIFLKNALVDSHNGIVFSTANKSDQVTIEAADNVIGDVQDDIRERILQSIPTATSKTMGLLKKLQVIFTRIIPIILTKMFINR